MRLMTVQPLEVLKTIEATGSFTATFSRTFEEFFGQFGHTYRWLADQMCQKIGKGKTEFPIWAWSRYDGDYRCMYSGGKYVKLELEIDSSRVVLSSFDAWCCVLLNGPLIDDDIEDYDTVYEAVCRKGQEAIEETWERIFDIPKEGWVQATFWELRAEDIVSAEIFDAQSPDDDLDDEPDD